MDAQGRITFRATKETERAAIEKIRKYLKSTVGQDDDAAVIRFALVTTDRELSRKKH
jgi:hypothetical protein